MARIYSWRLTKKDYAYLHIPNSKENISKRITDVNKIDEIIDYVSKLSPKEYKEHFDIMNKSVSKTLGVEIPWSDSFCDEKTATSSRIVYNSNEGKSDEIKEEILNELLERINALETKLEAKYDDWKTINDEQLLTTLSTANKRFDKAINTVNKISGTVETILNKKAALFDEAAEALRLDSEGINGRTLKSLYRDNDDLKEWKKAFSGGLRTIINDYNTFVEKEGPANFDKFNGIFVNMRDKITKTEDSVKTQIDKFKGGIKNIVNDVNKELTDNFNREKKELVDRVEGNFDSFSNRIEEKISKVDTRISSITNEIVNSVDVDIEGKVSKSIERQLGDVTSSIKELNENVSNLSGSVVTFGATKSRLASDNGAFEYRTSTGYEIVIDDETIRLKSDKAQIFIDENGIHLEGDVFINGKKI